MPIRIPELVGYFGGKGGSGTYQNIINLIPPHDTFIVPFLGHCGITRNIKPAGSTWVNDIDSNVIEKWCQFFGVNPESTKDFKIAFINSDWKQFLETIFDEKGHFIYCDPPYPHDSRKSQHRYKFEMTDDDHISLLAKAKSYQHAKVMISTYDNAIYMEHLKGWNKKSFPSMTRRGLAIETVYFNYDLPERLHDYDFFGNHFKEREHFKLKRERLVNRFKRMSAVEQGFYLEALNEFISNT